MQNLNLYLTTLPLSLSYSVLRFTSDQGALSFYFDEDVFFRKLEKFLRGLKERSPAPNVREEDLEYVRVVSLESLPKNRLWLLFYRFSPTPPFYCVPLVNFSPQGKTYLYLCFTEKEYALWFASIVDEVVKARVAKFGVG